MEEQEQLFLQQLRSSGLITRSAGIQMQIALVPNDDVELVPGSVCPNAFSREGYGLTLPRGPSQHLRWDTAEEYHVRCADGRQHSTDPMPGALRASLQPGDAGDPTPTHARPCFVPALSS